MMLDLSNPDQLPLKDLPEDIAVGMFMAWRNGPEVEFWRHGVWVATKAPIWLRTNIYRVCPAPVKKLIAPWEWLPDWVQAVAMEENSIVGGYSHIPTPGRSAWVRYSGYMICLSPFIKFDTAGIDWRTSLTMRPEGK